jgi:predicted phage terminase large subunit-like protein
MAISEQELYILEQYEKILAKETLLGFVKYTKPSFKPNWFHEKYYQVLSQFAEGKIKKLAVSVPPQHGKSEGSTRRLPPFLLGHKPDTKIAVVSYNASKARKFNREIQRIIETPEYAEIFPNTKLSNGSDGHARTSDEFEIVGYEGGVKTVGVGGPLTGEPVDVLILDDIYKDAKSAWSPVVQESIQDWFDTVADSRLHNDSRVLIVFTRWDENDLLGYILSRESDWTVINYEAIKTGAPSEYDPRKAGEPLWPERHSLDKLEKVRLRNPHVFESLYQGNPKPKEGLLYKDLRVYKELPSGFTKKKAVIDTADTGEDYLCQITYIPTPTGYFITDVYYTQDGMEVTEERSAKILTKQGVDNVRVESNNGGRGFARNVERNCRLLGNHRTSFRWYHQSSNKEVRIFTNAAEVQNMVFFPVGWEFMWPEFYSAVSNYKASGDNKHDDGPDALTMIIEAEQKREVGILEVPLNHTL